MKTTNSTPVKVKNVILHNGVSVCNGKLVLIPVIPDETFEPYVFDFSKENDRVGTFRKPIVISETEEIVVGDNAIFTHVYPSSEKFIVTGKVEKIVDGYLYFEGNTTGYKLTTLTTYKPCKKILVLAENFSPQQLQDIVDRKLKNGDEILVECEFYNDNPMHRITQIKFNKDNHINIFPVKGEELRDRLFKLANDFAIAKQGDIAVRLHQIHNELF